MLVLANIAGFIVAKWRLILLVLAALFVAFIVIAGGYRLWHVFNPPPHLDEKQIQRAQKAIETEDRQKMIDVLAESDTRVQEIDSNIKQIEQAREDAKKTYADKSNTDLANDLNCRAGNTEFCK